MTADEQSQQVFHLSPAYFTRLKRTILWMGIAVIPASMAFQGLTDRAKTTGANSTIVTWAFVTVIIVAAMYVSYKKQVARWQTFRVAISSDKVIRTQEGHEEVRVPASSFSRSVKVPGRGLYIYAGRTQPAIVIPETLEGFDDCCTLIQRFRPIEVRARDLFPRWAAIPAGLALLGLYSVFTQSTDSRVTIELGVLIASVFAFAAWRLYGSPDVDRRTKKHFAWALSGLTVTLGLQMWSTWNTPHRVEQVIHDDRLLSLLVKARPEVRDRLRDAMIAGEQNERDANGRAYVNPAARVLGELLPEYLPICSDAAAIRYAKETVTVLERLEADPSDICYRWLHSSGYHVDLDGVLGKDGLDPLADAMTEVVRSALETPQAVPNASEAEALRARALGNVTKDVSLHPLGLPLTDKKRSCRTVERTFKAILDLPEKQSSLVLRDMFSKARKG
jgi:hypothetical protein